MSQQARRRGSWLVAPCSQQSQEPQQQGNDNNGTVNNLTVLVHSSTLVFVLPLPPERSASLLLDSRGDIDCFVRRRNHETPRYRVGKRDRRHGGVQGEEGQEAQVRDERKAKT